MEVSSSRTGRTGERGSLPLTRGKRFGSEEETRVILVGVEQSLSREELSEGR